MGKCRLKSPNKNEKFWWGKFVASVAWRAENNSFDKDKFNGLKLKNIIFYQKICLFCRDWNAKVRLTVELTKNALEEKISF